MQRDLISGILFSVALSSQVQGRIAKIFSEQEVKQCCSFVCRLVALKFTLMFVFSWHNFIHFSS
jgi:hypothetical protein